MTPNERCVHDPVFSAFVDLVEGFMRGSLHYTPQDMRDAFELALARYEARPELQKMYDEKWTLPPDVWERDQ